MRKLLIVIIFTISCIIVNAQISLTIEGQTYINSDNHWAGVWVSRDEPTLLIFRNNSITSINESGYMLNCGSDSPAIEDHNLDGALIYGNLLDWNGTEPAALTHGMICGYNINYNVKYNYYDAVPYAVVIKSGQDGNNMVYTAGGYSYNIFKNSKNALILKGINGVCIYNNTFYRTNWNPVVVTNNTDLGTGKECVGIKIKNNIFYTREGIAAIRIFDAASIETLECDYNVYYCEGGDHTPTFTVRSTNYTLSEWKALGFDTHSVVINPDFIDTINLVPSVRLDYGTDLGYNWIDGLSVNAVWGKTNPATSKQMTVWQVGARIYDTFTSIPTYISSVIDNETPAILEMTYNMSLANIAPAASAFSVMVNSVTRSVSSVAISDTKVLLTLESAVISGDEVTVSYTKPVSNPLQTVAGDQAVSLSTQTVTNNVLTTNIFNIEKLPVTIYPNPTKGYVTIRIDHPTLNFDIVKFINQTGAVVLTYKVDPVLREFTIPINLKNGAYFVQLVSGKMTLFAQQLIVY